MLRTLRKVPSVARIVFASPRSAVRVPTGRLPLSALLTPQGSSTEEWSLIVALCRPRQGRQKANFCTERRKAQDSLRRLLFSLFTGGRLGPLGAPEPLSPRPCPLRCGGAFPEGARLARVASSPPQRPFQRNWQLTLGGFLSMYHQGTPPRYCQTLRHRNQTVFKHRLSAGTRVVSHRGILHDFHQQATTSCTTHELSLF